ncbi:MAG: agmatine deiminase family protein, partial [Planctomycetota bacterium]
MPAPDANPPKDLRQNARQRPAGVPADDPTYSPANAPELTRPLRPAAPHRGADLPPAVRTGPSHVIGSGAPSPADLGFRMPAEFEPHTRVWVTTPTNPDTWPGCLDHAQDQHAAFCGQLARAVEVKTTQSVGISPEDAWVRDYGPIFLIDDEGNLAANNFTFNCWGEKYPPWDKMDATPLLVADYVAHERGEPLPTWTHAMVLEGGSFGVNGQGALLTTEACLLHPKRNPALTKEQIEANLAATLNVSHFVWLPAGLEGDDTDGHQDDLAQWVSPDTVVAVKPNAQQQDHHDAAALNRNWHALERARVPTAPGQTEQRLTLVPLPIVDPPLYYPVAADYQTQRIERAAPSGGGLVPASYANFLISNGHLFVPVFGRPTDDLAIRQLEQAAPHLTIVPVRAEWLVVGLGALHCLTQQQPATRDDWVRKDEDASR